MSTYNSRLAIQDVHVAANRARDIRGAYMAQSLSDMSFSGLSLGGLIKSTLCALAVKAPQAGHRI